MVDHGFISVKGNSWCDVCGYRADEHEPKGTFACPICGEETRHTHSSLEIIEHRNKSRAELLAKSGTGGGGVGTLKPECEMTEAELDAELTANGIDPREIEMLAETTKAFVRGIKEGQRLANLEVDEMCCEWGAPEYVATDDGEAWYWRFPGHDLPVADNLSELLQAARQLMDKSKPDLLPLTPEGK